ncbi:MAG: DUF116 domain-containing protein [Planctomycetes bacterium]|nr:DUF116 domain-containing protein [Planctomycetota bacterium]
MGITDPLFIGLNRLRLNKLKKKKVAPEKLLILFSYCLQNSECPQKIVASLSNCKRCGKCTVKNILELGEKYRVRCVVASGGGMALEKVKASGAQVIIAIACEKELKLGIKGVFPKPVEAIPNKRPKGPCKDCEVDPEKIELALCSLCKQEE